MKTTQREVLLKTNKTIMKEPMITKSMTMELKKINTKKKRSWKLVEALLYKDLMERNIPTLPSFLVSGQSIGWKELQHMGVANGGSIEVL